MGNYSCAILGCGRMGVSTTERTRALLSHHWFPLSHADAAKENDRIDIIAVCDRDVERARQAASLLHLPTSAAFDSPEAMLNLMKPDILSIATRTPGRVDLIQMAIAHGVRAIHAEKPLSQDLVAGDRIMDEVRRNCLHFTYGTLRRFMTPYRMAKEMIDTGAIGAVQEVVIDHGSRELLMWSHPHSVDLLIYLCGSDVESVNAVCDFGGTEVVDGMLDCDPRVEFARVRFKSGRLGLITSSGGMNVRITGTEAAIHIVGNGDRLELHSKAGGTFFTKRDVIDVPHGRSGTAQAFHELVSALDGLSPLSIKPEDIALNQRLLWAIVTSGLGQGQMVPLSSVNESLIITGRSGDLTA